MNRASAPRRAAWIWAACLSLLVAGQAVGQTAGVVGAFEQIPAQAVPLAFDRGAFELPRGGHLQGIQMRFDAEAQRNLVFLSHDSATVGYLAIVEFPADWSGPGRLVHVHKFPSDGRLPPLRHAGGIQLAGDILAAGLEDNQQKTRSQVQFWNVAQAEHPVQLEHLTIRRSGEPEDMTAGAVGIVKRKNGYLVAAGNWDCRAIDFYASNGKPLVDPDCRFELVVRWLAGAADTTDWQPDKVFGEYQAINLFADANDNLFLIGPQTAGAKDSVDLFAIDLHAAPQKLLRKIASKPVRLPARMHFRYAGGVSVAREGLKALASPRNFGPQPAIGLTK